MAEVNEKVNVEKNEKVNAKEPVTKVNEDPYENFVQEDTQFIVEERNSDNAANSEKIGSTVLYDTPYFIQRIKSSKSKDGFQYYNYQIGWKKAFKGHLIDTLILLELVNNTRAAHEMLDVIYGDKNIFNFCVKRIEKITYNNGRENSTYSYSFLIRDKDESGFTLSYELLPRGKGSREEVGHFIDFLKTKGIVK